MKTRIISAIVMCLIIIPILIIGGISFKIMATVLAIASMYELTKIREKDNKLPLIIKLMSYVLLIVLVLLGTSKYSNNYELIYRITIAIFLIYFIPVVLIDDKEKYSITDALYILGGTLFIGVAYNSFVLINNTNLQYVIYLILVTTVTDSFGYFTGYFIGKHKLCEKISPKKTWEGFIGGSLVGTIISVIYYIIIINETTNLWLIILVTLFLTIIGQIGDLFFSSIKRHYKIKDFSNLIPGHGGVLDRLDSIIFVVLTFTLLINFL